MRIEDFLKKFIEGYLFHDLESMAKITLPPGQNDGAAGYPMMSTILSGMEILGILLMPNPHPFDPNRGNDYFLNYWDNYFVQQNPAFTGLGRLFRQLVRHGISHTFVAKPGIFVEKGTNKQMSIDASRQEIYIDCNVFFKEFEDSYLKLVMPIITGTAFNAFTIRDNMQTQLDNLSTVYSADSIRLFDGLPALHSSTNTGRRAQVPVSPFFSSTNASGASLSIPYTITTTSSDPNDPFTPPSTTEPFVTISGTLPPKKKS